MGENMIYLSISPSPKAQQTQDCVRQKNPACRCAARLSQKHSITQFHLHNLHYITFSFLVQTSDLSP